MENLSVEKVLWIKHGQGIAAAGHIPKESEFFKDHFPDFPILPGVLALEMLKQTAECYLRAEAHQVPRPLAVPEQPVPARAGDESHGRHFFLKQIRATRFSIYLKPGDKWESQLELVSEANGETHWNARLLHKGQTAVTAQLTLAESHAHEKAGISEGG